MYKESIEDDKEIAFGNSFQSLKSNLNQGIQNESISKINFKLEDIQEAHNRIKTQVSLTPIVEAKHVGNNFCNVFFKCENLQKTGSFKARGTCNAISSMSPGERSKGCVISGGRNFLNAMTYYGFKESVPITVIIPRDCPVAEKQKYKENYAIIKVDGNNLNEASLNALAYCNKTGSNYVRSSDRLDLFAGYGTVGLEILSQMEKLDAIICPVGTGGLVSSILLAVKSLKPSCLVYGVESSNVPKMTKALHEKRPTMVTMKPSIADSIAEIIASNNAFNIIRGYLDRMITVDENWISQALVHMFEREKIVVEPAAACSMAAIMADKVPELRGKNVVCIISGGNVDMSLLPRIINRGMVAEGRLLTVCATLLDSPGTVAKLLEAVAETGANVRSVAPERSWIRKDVLNVTVHILIEVSDSNHGKEVEKRLLKDYPHSQISIL